MERGGCQDIIYMIREIHTSLVIFTAFGRDDLQEKIEIGGKLFGVKYV